jgi:lipoate-protein ligase A
VSALAPAEGELRVLDGPDRLSPHDDIGVGPALLDAVAADGRGGWLRLYRPRPTVAFSRRDTLSPGFGAATAAGAAAGYTPVLRAPGGRAVVYDQRALCVDLAVADPDPGAEMLTRFVAFGALLVAALSSLGVVAEVAPVPGEYCPGRYSVSSGGRKLAGSAQRLVRGGWLLGAVLQVGRADEVRDVVRDVYAALGEPCDPDTVGAVADLAPGVSVAQAADAVRAAFGARVGLVETGAPPDLLSAARTAAAGRRLPEPAR